MEVDNQETNTTIQMMMRVLAFLEEGTTINLFIWIRSRRGKD